jgi:hypothetical protein
MNPEETTLVVMALAHLAVERPGWYHMTSTFAEKLEGGTPALFNRFHALRLAHVELTGKEDAIMQLREVVERTNPVLWAMVREIAWPGGRED